jgi:hypothetical protein
LFISFVKVFFDEFSEKSNILNDSLFNNLQLYAIDFAVSFLSPVKTQILIPALMNDSKASSTLSCN